MSIIELLKKELEEESAGTRKMLALVPHDQFGWKPHEKSMLIKNLAVHLAELPGWIQMAFNTTELDFATMDYKPTEAVDTAEILSIFEASLEKGKAALSNATDADLWPTWTMRTGDQVHSVLTKYEVVRHALGQMIHHRAQLGVYLRLLHIPIPGVYGPSADEMNF